MVAAFQSPQIYLPRKIQTKCYCKRWELMLHLWKYYSQFIHKEVNLERITNPPKWIWTQQQFQHELLQLFLAMFRCLRTSNFHGTKPQTLSEFVKVIVAVALKYMSHPEIQITCANLLKKSFDKLKPAYVSNKLAFHVLKLLWHWQATYSNVHQTAEAAKTLQNKIIPSMVYLRCF